MLLRWSLVMVMWWRAATWFLLLLDVVLMGDYRSFEAVPRYDSALMFVVCLVRMVCRDWSIHGIMAMATELPRLGQANSSSSSTDKATSAALNPC